MQKALDLIEAGSLPHSHSHACVVVDEAGAAEVELSFFDYQRQAYIGESGLSPQPFFFNARKRMLADGRSGYVVGPEVTRFLRRDARFGVASREGRLGDVRCKVRTYVEAKEGLHSVVFASTPRERAQGETPGIFYGVPPALRPAPTAVSIGADAAASRKAGLDVSVAFEKRGEESAGLETTIAFDGRKEQEPGFRASTQAETSSRQHSYPSTHTAAASASEGTSISESDKFSWTLGSILLAICLLALMAVAMDWPDSLTPSGIEATVRRLVAALVLPDTRTTSLEPVDRYEAERNSMDHSQQDHGVLGVPPKQKAPAAPDTRPNIVAFPPLPEPVGVTATETAPSVSSNEESESASSAPVTECDRLTASPYDPDRIDGVAGVQFYAIPDHAVAECLSAAKAYPSERRLTFQLGRALDKAKRYSEARDAYASASAAGSSAAANGLGVMYKDSHGVAEDGVKAVNLFRKAAEKGYSVAIANLGLMYANGRGVARDDAKAVRLYRKAADMGNARAVSNLGLMYVDGRGVARDDAKAVRLFRKAADVEDDDAIFYLGWMYENGRGVPRDAAEAVRLYRKAAELGVKEARKRLAKIDASQAGKRRRK